MDKGQIFAKEEDSSLVVVACALSYGGDHMYGCQTAQQLRHP